MDHIGYEIHRLNGHYKLVRARHPSISENSEAVASSTSLGAIKAAWSLLVQPQRPFPEQPEPEKADYTPILSEV
jgi:hypothetical protein